MAGAEGLRSWLFIAPPGDLLEKLARPTTARFVRHRIAHPPGAHGGTGHTRTGHGRQRRRGPGFSALRAAQLAADARSARSDPPFGIAAAQSQFLLSRAARRRFGAQPELACVPGAVLRGVGSRSRDSTRAGR